MSVNHVTAFDQLPLSTSPALSSSRTTYTGLASNLRLSFTAYHCSDVINEIVFWQKQNILFL